MNKKTVLYAPDSYWKATQEERDMIVNGCGSAQAKFDFVPDTIYGLNINEACNIHDWMYHFAKPNIKAKEEADRVFLNNMIRLIEAKTKWKWLKCLRRKRARKYYLAVKYFGGPAFWAGKNKNKNIKEIT